MKIKIPEEVEKILNTLYKNGFQGYVVGGCVRDTLLGRVPNDWDIATNAKPNQMLNIFKDYKVVPTGIKHGTVTIIVNNKQFEVTTYRIEGKYSDNRRPDKVEFTDDLEKDLSRRDFTINAMAYNYEKGLIDPYNGFSDLLDKKVKCVGNPDKKFEEDALRMIRAVRFSSQLDFEIDEAVTMSIVKNSKFVRNISKERIKTELNKILLSNVPSNGIKTLVDTDLIDYIIPEIREIVGFEQYSPYHDKDVFYHTMTTLDNTESDLILRLSALLHDIAKPRCFTIDKYNIGHFYNHCVVGAEMAEEILKKLKYDKKTISSVKMLIKNHMLRLNEITAKTVKRLINKMGTENVERLFKLQIADVKGSKYPHDFSNIEKAVDLYKKILSEKEPLTLKDLDIDGYDLIEIGIPRGREMGIILKKLLEKVFENPEMNKKKLLIQEAVFIYNNIREKTNLS
ncbi:CCA tRNA nucleotidyltransferase [Caminicella sporogenes]|uniref:CCA tRNA nucleotidyltransferase n=1 Tax=Caminicella sporogenes TaxID=166485 RepID=UPI002540FCEB|nr:HD domain-containing protein [Caminicella sporogenes]WIF94242.1 HD domain-containing protein [Caminicella sporogenes]